MQQVLRCLLRMEDKLEQSRCAHDNCESRWRKNVKDFKSIVSKSRRCKILQVNRNSLAKKPGTALAVAG